MKLVNEPIGFGASRHELSNCVVESLGSDYAPTYLVFDGSDYSGASDLLSEFRGIGFTWIHGQSTANVPGYMLGLMSEPASAAITWLSKRVVEFPDTLFAWILAHECRHVFQSRCAWPRDEVMRNVATLRRRTGYLQMPPGIFGPDEIDAEIFAFKKVPGIVGKPAFDDFYASQMLPRYPYPDYRSFIREVAVL